MRIWPAIFLAGLLLSGCGPSATPDTQKDDGNKAQPAPAERAKPPAEQNITPTVELGKMLFRRCVACHTVEAAAPHGIGPNLHDIIGRDIGALPDFAYSDAMRNQAGVWDEPTLDAFLANPKKFMPANRMAFGGVMEAADRKALYLYLKQAK